MLGFFLDLVFPRQCLGCGKWGKYICERCTKEEVEYFLSQVCPYCERQSPYGLTHPRCQKENGLDGMFVLAHYRGLIPRVIRSVKYAGYFAILDEVAILIFENYHFVFDFDYFVPVPLSKNRERERGFNQSKKLAKELAESLLDHRTTRLPTKVKVVDLLVRARETKPQFDLKMEERKDNVKDAFKINPRLLNEDLKGLSFCLVDDVATTGATLFECAKVLKKIKAEKVWAITIARGG